MTRIPFPRSSFALASTAAALMALGLIIPKPAQACGGFFCSQNPIAQSGEQIIFGVEPGKVSATIQINYTGEAKDFAWVIPVASQPEITLAPGAMFNEIGMATQPQYYLNWNYDDGVCGWWQYEIAADGARPGPPNAGSGVEVVDEQEVGPYQTATLKSNDAQELWQWLSDNGFDQPEASIPLIEHYLAQQMFFVAMKLKQDASAGDIQPVTLTMDEDAPCVPLVLTQVAATPDMPVRIYVLGDERAMPTNWFHVILNEKKIDWVGYGSNYNAVVTQAVDEAAGHGFVTEFAGDSSILDKRLWWDGRFGLVDQLENILWPSTYLDHMLDMGFPRDAQMQALIKKHIPKPAAEDLPSDCQTDQEFYTWNISKCLQYMPEDWTFDPVAFTNDIKEKIIEPLKTAQALFDSYTYLTRLYTTVSPEEMTRDPFFAFNKDLPDVANIHQADATAECDEDGNFTTITITLEGGETYVLEGEFSPWGPGNPDPMPNEPAAAVIELIGPTGAPIPIDPSIAKQIDERLQNEDPSFVLADLEQGIITGPTVNANPTTGGGGATLSPFGCQGGSLPMAPLFATLAVLGLAILRRQ